MTWAEHHQASEKAALAAHEHARLGRDDQARICFQSAAEAEEQALGQVDPGTKARTYSITAASAVALWFKAGMHAQAHRLAAEVMQKESLAAFARAEIESLLSRMSASAQRARGRSEKRESVIAADLTIAGRIVGSGHVRIAGHFKGDVEVDGHLTIDRGAILDGHVRALAVTIAGELRGNILSARRVELQQGAVVVGNVTTASLTVAAGAHMRGQVEFGSESEKRTDAWRDSEVGGVA